MKIATFNANSIRMRQQIVLDWLEFHQPDVLALQEIKCEDDVFPRAEFEAMGYRCSVHGQKSYNGVALLTKRPLVRVTTGFRDAAWPEDRRIIAAEMEGLWVINTYVPNGSKVGSDKWTYKLSWLEKFADYLRPAVERGIQFVWLGDINIAPTPDDVFDSARHLGGVGHHPDEFERLDKIKALGLTDLFRQFNEGPGHYTYWDFFIKNALDRKLGWRIDHIYATAELASRCTACEIDYEPRRLEKPSDHTFVMATFED
ncbi:MAG: exodeoxyribonuclease III [Armatimonadetes bacterium]|nr:exodeoxyribonuclease III [Armatimonadota bacterium]